MTYDDFIIHSQLSNPLPVSRYIYEYIINVVKIAIAARVRRSFWIEVGLASFGIDEGSKEVLLQTIVGNC